MSLDILFGLVSVCLVLGVVGAVIVLPIVALVRATQVGRRLDRLEHELHELRRSGAPRAAPAPREAIAEHPPPQAPRELEPPVEGTLAEPRPEPEHAVSALEALIGARALGWVAVVLLLIATAFFLRLV